MSLERITSMATELINREQHLAVLVQDAKDAKAALDKLKMEDLPDLMREFGLMEIKLANGFTVSVTEDVSCGITEAKHDAAMRWLVDHQFGGLIKTVVSIEFGRGEIDEAQALAKRLTEDGTEAMSVETVHASTLKAFVREELEKGNAVPFDLFGVHPYSYAKVIKPPKSRIKKEQ